MVTSTFTTPRNVETYLVFSLQKRVSLDNALETAELVNVFLSLHSRRSDRFTNRNYRIHSQKDNRGWHVDHILILDDMIDAVQDVQILSRCLFSY